MDEQLIALYHRHVANAFDRKLRLTEFAALKAGKAKAKYDIATATLAFGPTLKFEAPLLGSHAHGNNSWLWAWSNRNLKLTITNRALGDLVRVTAHRIGVAMLAHTGFSLEPLLGEELTKKHAAEVLGIILSRELDFDAYQVLSEDNYDSTILVRHDKLKFTERYPLHRVLTVFPQVVDELPVYNQRDALSEYAKSYGLTVTAVPGGLEITGGKGKLSATFDDHDKLTKLEGTDVAAPPKKPKKVVAKKPAAKAKPAPAPKAKAKPAVKPIAKKPAPKKPATKAGKPAPKPVVKKPAKKR